MPGGLTDTDHRVVPVKVTEPVPVKQSEPVPTYPAPAPPGIGPPAPAPVYQVANPRSVLSLNPAMAAFAKAGFAGLCAFLLWQFFVSSNKAGEANQTAILDAFKESQKARGDETRMLYQGVTASQKELGATQRELQAEIRALTGEIRKLNDAVREKKNADEPPVALVFPRPMPEAAPPPRRVGKESGG